MQYSIIGYGDLGKQIHNLLSQEYQISNVAIFDNEIKSDFIISFPFDYWNNSKFKESIFFIGLGYKHLGYKLELLSNLIATGRKIQSLIHKTSYVDSSSTIKGASILYPMSNIDKNVIIHEGTIINNSVVVSHDSIIGKCCYISPGVVISGNVQIGNKTFIGSGVVISNGVKIGNNVKIGIGTIVTSDINDDCSVIGNPMKYLKHSLELH